MTFIRVIRCTYLNYRPNRNRFRFDSLREERENNIPIEKKVFFECVGILFSHNSHKD